MAFTIRNTLDPNTAATRWSSGVQGAGAKLLAGYTNPRRDPQANPSVSAAAWLSGVTGAQPTYQAGLAGYSSAAAVASMTANGVPRYTSAATTKKPNYLTAATGLLPAIATGVAGLPTDRSTPTARDNRNLAMSAYMRTLKGKFHA